MLKRDWKNGEIEWSPTTENDFNEIIDYIAQDSSQAAIGMPL